MRLKYLLAGAVLAVGLAGAAAANAVTTGTVIGTEDAASGFTGNLFESVFPGTHYLVASDGESPFHPFGATFDTSDGLDFSGVDFVWDQASDSSWTNIGHQTWVLPASTSCGTENEPACELVGHFISPTVWNEGAIGTWLILEAGTGKIDDKIITYNTKAGGELKFFSDPFAVPEASTWTLMLVGFGGLGAMLRRSRRSAVTTA